MKMHPKHWMMKNFSTISTELQPALVPKYFFPEVAKCAPFACILVGRVRSSPSSLVTRLLFHLARTLKVIEPRNRTIYQTGMDMRTHYKERHSAALL
jgi:hypothetical protein